jgi:hypothetical protein
MRLSAQKPFDVRFSAEIKTSRQDLKGTKADKSQGLSDMTSSDVREKLSSTRHLLEQTLSKKSRVTDSFNTFLAKPSESEISHHKQLKEPGFEELNHIYENYMKVPYNQKLQSKTVSNHRYSSAPPIWQKTKQQLLQEKEEKFKKECTFKPSINAMPSNKNLDYCERKFNREEWFSNLTKPKSEIIQQREKLKREKEEEDNKNCSFRPTISNFGSTGSINVPVGDRLYNLSENKLLKREQRKREKEELEAMSYPFSPQIAESVTVLIDNRKNQPPLYQRLYEVQNERLNNKNQAREKVEKSEELTFKPQISQTSRRLAAKKCSGSVTERLSRETSRSKERKTENSISFTSTSSKTYRAKEFMERQQEFYEKSKQKKVNFI